MQRRRTRRGLRPCADGHRAASPQAGQDGPLGHDGTVRGRIVNGGEQGTGGVVVSAALHGDRALPRLGQHVERVEDVAEAMHPAQSLHRRHRDHHRADRAVFTPGDAPFHVPPDLGETQIGARVGQLGAAARRAGGDETSGWEVGHGAADEPVAGIGARGDGSDHERGRHGRGHVLGGMDCRIRPPPRHCRLHFGHEDPLAADLIERRRKIVALRPYHHHLDLEVPVSGLQQLGDQLGLTQCQR